MHQCYCSNVFFACNSSDQIYKKKQCIFCNSLNRIYEIVEYLIFKIPDDFSGFKLYLDMTASQNVKPWSIPWTSLSPQADPYPPSIPKRKWSRPIHKSGSPRADPYPNFDATSYIYYIQGICCVLLCSESPLRLDIHRAQDTFIFIAIPTAWSSATMSEVSW